MPHIMMLYLYNYNIHDMYMYICFYIVHKYIHAKRKEVKKKRREKRNNRKDRTKKKKKGFYRDTPHPEYACAALKLPDFLEII